MSAITDAIQKLQADKGTSTIKKVTVPINAELATKLYFITQALEHKEDRVSGEFLSAAITEAWDQLKDATPDKLPSEDEFEKKLRNTAGRKKKTVKKVTSSTADTVQV